WRRSPRRSRAALRACDLRGSRRHRPPQLQWPRSDPPYWHSRAVSASLRRTTGQGTTREGGPSHQAILRSSRVRRPVCTYLPTDVRFLRRVGGLVVEKSDPWPYGVPMPEPPRPPSDPYSSSSPDQPAYSPPPAYEPPAPTVGSEPPTTIYPAATPPAAPA